MSALVSKRVGALLVSTVFLAVPAYGFSQCFTLAGKTLDIETHRPVSVELQAYSDKRKVASTRSDTDGHFELGLPCASVTHISIQSMGFRALTLPLVADSPDAKVFFVQVLIFPKSREGVDVPYEQSEQSEVSLSKAASGKATSSRTFKIFDAFSREEIRGNVCLFYTKSGDKKCFDTPAGVVFEEEDIVAIEVEAEGYQGFHGNIITRLDNTDNVFEIHLMKVPVIFSFQLTEHLDSSVRMENPATGPLEVLPENGLYFGSAPLPGDYTITAGGHSHSRRLLPGINLFTLESITPVAEAELPGTLLFEQSGFTLSEQNAAHLNNLVKYLKTYTAYRIRIVGHTDNIGLPHLNQTLSTYRATVVYKYLLDKGIAEERMRWDSYGDKFPAAVNTSEEQRKLNRRVVIEILE